MLKMVLLAMSLLLACMPTPTLSTVTNLQMRLGAPLEFSAKWDDDKVQTYRVTIRDIPARKSYVLDGFTGKEFLFDAAGQAQLLFSTTPLSIIASQDYGINIMGADNTIVSNTIGRFPVMHGPPAGPVICDVTDETSPSEFEPTRGPPHGCQNTQVSGKVRIYYDQPIFTGWPPSEEILNNMLGWVFQWSLDSTFTTDVFEERCMSTTENDPNEGTTSIANGDVCNWSDNIAQIPSTGTLPTGQYFIRVAAMTQFGAYGLFNDLVSFGVGPFTEAVSAVVRPESCPDGQYEGTDACIDCPVGTNSTKGTSNIAGCKCIKGYTAGSDGVVCTACAANFWKNVIGSSNCIACPIGQKSPMGSQDVSNCRCS